jgi:hypothetical protein
MKFFKTYIFSLTIVACFCAFNVFAVSQFPDSLKLQPIPSGVHPGNPGNINKNESTFKNNNLILSQISQYTSNPSVLDANASYADTINHRLFVADPDNNRVFVFDLDQNNVLIDNIPDNVLGQPDFTSSDPGTTQSTFNNPNGIAYDPASNKLFVADTNNNRIMVFGAASTKNGENALSIINPNENSAMMSPPIIARLQSKPKNSASFTHNKATPLNPILLLLIGFSVIAVLVAVLFFYAAKNKKNMEAKP